MGWFKNQLDIFGSRCDIYIYIYTYITTYIGTPYYSHPCTTWFKDNGPKDISCCAFCETPKGRGLVTLSREADFGKHRRHNAGRDGWTNKNTIKVRIHAFCMMIAS